MTEPRGDRSKQDREALPQVNDERAARVLDRELERAPTAAERRFYAGG